MREGGSDDTRCGHSPVVNHWLGEGSHCAIGSCAKEVRDDAQVLGQCMSIRIEVIATTGLRHSSEQESISDNIAIAAGEDEGRHASQTQTLQRLLPAVSQAQLREQRPDMI